MIHYHIQTRAASKYKATVVTPRALTRVCSLTLAAPPLFACFPARPLPNRPRASIGSSAPMAEGQQGGVPAPWHPTYDVDKARLIAQRKRSKRTLGARAAAATAAANALPSPAKRPPKPKTQPTTQVIRDALEEDTAGVGDLTSLST